MKTVCKFFLTSGKILAGLIVLALLISSVVYINLKSFTVKKIRMSDAQNNVQNHGQEVYLMGTFHTSHFDKMSNYSIEEMLNAVKNINPDVIFIEAREENFDRLGIVDGPVDMCIAYSYCQEFQIPVEMIDYWKVDNDTYKKNTTTEDRDNHIHQNIMKKLKQYDDKKILIICGFGHLYPQCDRLLSAGGKKEKIPHAGNLFKCGEDGAEDSGDFKYPSSICDVWEKRSYFYAHTYPESIQADENINADVKAQWPVDTTNRFYNSQMKYCELFKNNRIYREK